MQRSSIYLLGPLRLAGLGILLVIGVTAEQNVARGALAGLERVAPTHLGLDSPLYATHAPGDPTRLFILERGKPVDGMAANSTGNIRILDLTTGVLEPTPFLTVTGIHTAGEGGMLGMTFHPDYASNGKFYLYLTADDGVAGTAFSSYVREYTRSEDPNVANSGYQSVLEFAQPQIHHNGGWIGFSPNDHYLYVMSGDGGGSYDSGSGHTEPDGNAQDITDNFLGKVLRIDVDRDDFPTDDSRNYGIPYDSERGSGNPFAPDTPGGVDPEGDNEIWAFGLRNPYRASFDRMTGDLWIGDVGQDSREEINFQPADSLGGANYGWRLREGSIETPNPVGGPPPTGAVEPIWDYKRINDPTADPDFTGNTVIGGYAYRGPDPGLQGLYFFADTVSGRIWSLRRPTETSPMEVNYVSPLLPPINGSEPNVPVSFGEDAVGNLYVIYFQGGVWRIVTDQLVMGDFDADGSVDEIDYSIWAMNFASNADLRADANGDQVVNAADYVMWRNNFGGSPYLQDNGATANLSVPEPAGLLPLLLMVCGAGVIYRTSVGNRLGKKELTEVTTCVHVHFT